MSGILDVGFELDDFQKPKIFSVVESIAQQVINTLVMEPGKLPSMPNIGLGIKKYMNYCIEGSIDVDELRNGVFNQCSLVSEYIDVQRIEVYETEFDGKGLIFMSIPILIAESSILIGFQQEGTSNALNYDFKIEANNFV